MLTYKKRISFIVIIGFLLTGCASFQGGNLREIRKLPSPPQQKLTAEVNFEFRQIINGAPVNLFRNSAGRSLRNDLIWVFRDSKHFKKIDKNVKNPDLVLNFDMTNEGYLNQGMAFLTGLTLYTVPSWATDRYILKVEVKNLNSGKFWEFELNDFVTTYSHIVLVPVMPFKMTPMVAGNVQENMYKHLLVAMKDEGVFQPGPTRTKKQLDFNLAPQKD